MPAYTSDDCKRIYFDVLPQLRLVHWCHGAPGFIPLLACAAAAFPDDAVDFTAAAVQAGEVVWERGLLKKVLSLWLTVSWRSYRPSIRFGPLKSATGCAKLRNHACRRVATLLSLGGR